ncbi:protein kinase domain-containing protein [Rhodococcus koreensis]
MVNNDHLATQRDVITSIGTELSAAGFEDARQIGCGGFGEVYRCLQPALDRTVAIKILTVPMDEENTARFLREQRAMGTLTGHPNIASILQVGITEEGRPYIVMPYYSQDSLDAWIRRRGPLSVDDILRVGIRLAGALETAHRRGIIHRDVKPANILLTDYGEPLLTDFGIARIQGGFETQSGAITGSPAFIAPEVLRGELPNSAADVYGLGATMFAALTGHAAFERRPGEQVVAQFIRITSQSVPDLREKGIPDDVSRAIGHAMDAEPTRRPATAGAFGEELQQIQLHRGQRVDEMALLGDSNGLRLGAFGTAAGLPRASSNLPSEATTFIGRRREIAEAREKLTTSRELTLTGIGGVGKTRLALRVATDLLHEFHDGVWLVELGELRDDALLVDVVAEALAIRNSSGRPLEEVVVELLSHRNLLLILDNCEHVVAAVARLAARLLQLCPDLKLLTTSRERLGIHGEVVLHVPPLTLPTQPAAIGEVRRFDALKLFVERAEAAVPGYTASEQDWASVADICTRLDGLPLAIELAAARMRVMSPQQLLRRLTERFALLTTGERNAPTRQQTLRMSIDWSYELCTPHEQQVWQQLSTFAGSFDLAAVEYLCADSFTATEVLDEMTSLIDKSIVNREPHDGRVRFRMLETIRQYGREQAQRGNDSYGWRCRHRDWYWKLAVDADAEWISPSQLEWITRLVGEQPNLREALDFSIGEPPDSQPDAALAMVTALFRFWLARGLLNEGRHWIERSLSRPSGPIKDRIRALYVDSVLVELQGDLATGAALVEECKTLALSLCDSDMDAWVKHAAGLLAMYRGDQASACRLMEDALAEFTERGERAQQVWSLVALGLAYEFHGDTDRSIECHRSAIAISEAHGEFVYRSYSEWALGVALVRKGDYVAARSVLEQALGLIQRAGEPLAAAMCLEVLAWIAAAENHHGRAAVLMGAAEALGRATGSSSVLFRALVSDHDACERSTRSTLGEDRFETGLDKGRQLSFEGALAYALED